MALTDDDVREILRLIDESGLDELRIDMEGFSLHVRRGGGAPLDAPAPAPARTAASAPPAPPPAAASPPAAEDGLATVDAPMLGTFYRAEAPGRPPFVEVGSVVEAGTVIGLIEVMKMMNSIEAGVAGTVVEVCAGNAQLVEYGEPLLRVRPDGA
jgi:acetyl-CoA carboxylase biotin carboxyl carrier protein